MVERGPRTVECDEQAERVRERIATHLRESGHRISSEQLESLFDSIDTADLSNDPLAAELGRTPLAKVNGREITFDRRYKELNPAQQTHVLLHEYGHGLVDFFASRENNSGFVKLAERVGQLPPEQISYYVGYLSENLESSPENAYMLQNERLAEVIAQYLESDRTFGGFVRAKLLEFPNQESGLSEEMKARYQQIGEEIGSVNDYLELIDDEEHREAFLAHHSGLAEQFQVWQELNSIFTETDFDELPAFNEASRDTRYSGWEDDELFDGIYADELGAELMGGESTDPLPSTIYSEQKGEKRSSDRLIEEVVSFWQIFPPSSEKADR